MPAHRIFSTPFAAVYPMYLEKARRKGRTQQELDQIICWLTGYDDAGLRRQIEQKTDFETFFDQAPALHPDRSLIKGVVCGVRVEEVGDPLMQKIRQLDKLVDELAKGKAMDKILRGAPMKIAHLDHFTIVAQPAEIEQLREFYCQALGLQPGPRPDFPFPGYWLYPPGGGPIVHLAGITGRAPPEGPRDTGKLDHVSFRATGLEAVRKHLASLGIDFREAPVPGFPLHQLFFHDPVGIKVELTFEVPPAQ